MSSTIAAALQKLKNKNGDCIWRDGLTTDARYIIRPSGLRCTETMPTGGANQAVIAFW